jgi:YD repeat-containing protein
VDYVYNGLGQIGQVRSSPTPIAPTDPLVTGVVYNAAGQATQVDYANGVTTTQTYNDRLQLATVEHRNPTQSLLNLAYGYGSTNNGQIRAITDGTDPSRSTTFTYL